jgi:hypothetical protein
MKRLKVLNRMKRGTKFTFLLVVLLVAGSVLLLYQQITPTSQANSSDGTSTTGNSSSNLAFSAEKKSSVSSFTISNSLTTTARYTVDGSPTGQWLVIQATFPILSVSASDTGIIPEYRSLSSLNQTSIGYECSQRASDGSCVSFEYVQQTGWFWDSAGRTLTVHYLGGANVTLTVIEQP